MMINLNNALKLSAAMILMIPTVFTKAQIDPAGKKYWIAKWNSYTKMLLGIDKKYSPEFGSQQGLPYYDTLIAVLNISA